MLNLFSHDLGKGNKEFTNFVLTRMMQVSDEVDATDVKDIEYMEHLYHRVLEDSRIAPEDRSLMDFLDKLEEDVMFNRKVFGDRARFVLNFLEANILRYTIIKTRNDKERRILGAVLRIRNTWLKEEEEQTPGCRYETPKQMKAYLDDYVIGQEEAKRVIATAVYGHGLRNSHRDLRFAPNIVLLIGPSGCGKTEIMRRIQEITEYPMVFTDVSSLGASQYRGRHKEDVLLSLWEKAGRKNSLAEKGIIFMDEFDKLLLPAYSEKGVNLHDDVQSQLLTMLEGSDVELRAEGKSFTLSTRHMLFVLAGAFQGIEEYIKKEQMSKGDVGGNIGFLGVPVKEMDISIAKHNISHEVLMKYGMKRELAGRISRVAVLEALGKEELRNILTETKDNLLERFAREIKLSSGADLIFTSDAVEAIVEKVHKDPIGARALRNVVHKAVKECIYEAPSKVGIDRILITREVIEETGEPQYRSESVNEGVWNEETL